jgi:hypothetical protein|nr:MAG TPA: Pvc1, Pvc9, Pvc11, Pvc12, Pvc4, Photorhabdus asymbiotica, PVC, contractile.5A [Caudoviricetes sp.]DAL82051.1 MAG TPA: Pvc1, Pvc9, Pvc11, Pvc12, Pvc4, Photorhabdus asymbiotica, PVC, contractile.5A [Caudoviricetes sp.]
MDMYEKFLSVTGYNIKDFFQSYVDFCSEYYPYIVDYYQGGEINADSFYELDKLIAQINIIEPLFQLHENKLDDISMWELLESFSEIVTKLTTIKNSDRWLRSASVGRTNTLQLEKQLRTGETFETVSEQLELENPEDDWVDIVVPQYIIEEDYITGQGSNTFSVNLKNVGINYVDNVVDTLVDENILGKDLSTEFVFENEDLKIIKFQKSMEQALQIILEAVKGCIPEFTDYGLPSDFIGQTTNAIQYPIIFKSLMNMFQRDNRWASAELIDLKKVEDSIFMKVRATTVTKEDFLINVPI